MIVVGIDGSPGSRLALEFAVGEAELRGSDLRLVCTWQVPMPVYGGAMMAPTVPVDPFAEESRELAARQMSEVLAGHADVGAELVLREGSAARLLVEESKQAELLVVGSRGRGGFAGLLMGSVSQQCAVHASCPVVIVPAPAQHTDQG